MGKYVESKVATEVSLGDTTLLMPWCVIQKVESSGQTKSRLMSDFHLVNKRLQTPHFKLDHSRDTFPLLEQGMWASKMDLKNAYFMSRFRLPRSISSGCRWKTGAFKWGMLALGPALNPTFGCKTWEFF